MRVIISGGRDLGTQFTAMAEAQRRYGLTFDAVTISLAEQAEFKTRVGEKVFEECFPDITSGRIYGIDCEVES